LRVLGGVLKHRGEKNKLGTVARETGGALYAIRDRSGRHALLENYAGSGVLPELSPGVLPEI